MADSTVHITGSESGAFTAAYDGLPAWATEGTLSTIHGILVKSLKAQESSLKQLSNLLRKAAGKTGAGGADPEVKKYLASLAKSGEAADKFRQELEEANKAVRAKREEEEKSATSIASWTTVLSSLAGVGNKALDIQKQYVTTSTDLFNAGINLLAGQEDGVTSMQSLNQMVARTGIRLENLQKVVEKYSSSINAVGITRFSKTLARANSSLESLGYSSQEQAELLGSMMEAQSSYSDLRNKTDQELAAGAIQFGQQLNRLSLLTGQSRAALMENIKTMSANSDSMVIASIAGRDAAARVTNFATSFKDSNIQNMIQRFAAATDAAQDGMYQSLVRATGGPQAAQFAETSQQLRDGMISEVEARERMIGIASRLSDADIQALKRQQLAGNVDATPALEAIAALRMAGYRTSQATDEQADAAVRSRATVAGLATEIERTASLTQVAFPALESSITALTATMRTLNSAAVPLATGIGATVGNFLSSTAVVAGFTAQVALTILSLRALNSAVRDISGMAQGQAGTGAANGTGAARRRNMGRIGAGVGAVSGLGINYAGGLAEEAGYTRTGAALEIGGAALTGASTGAMLGSFIPGLGTIIGGAVGGAVGTAIGTYQNWDTLTGAPKEPKRSTIDSTSDVAAKTKMPEATDKSTTLSTAAPATTDTVTGTGSINSIMTQQVRILNEILTGTLKLVSVNNEILRVSRTHS